MHLKKKKKITGFLGTVFNYTVKLSYKVITAVAPVRYACLYACLTDVSFIFLFICILYK